MKRSSFIWALLTLNVAQATAAQITMVPYADSWFLWSTLMPTGDEWAQRGPYRGEGDDPQDVHHANTHWLRQANRIDITIYDWIAHPAMPTTVDKEMEDAENGPAKPFSGSDQMGSRTLDYERIDRTNQTYTYQTTWTFNKNGVIVTFLDYYRTMRFGMYGVTIECGYEQTAAIEAKIMLDKMVANFKVGPILDKARFAITFGILGQLTRNPLAIRQDGLPYAVK
ncbi:MAG TPA: hypothetical protein VK775_14570 [Chthoniobacterales bacterium]|jgi:hypothetical protein|nr:hypothetical protein [Chthoniobacterales bacterium]